MLGNGTKKSPWKARLSVTIPHAFSAQASVSIECLLCLSVPRVLDAHRTLTSGPLLNHRIVTVGPLYSWAAYLLTQLSLDANCVSGIQTSFLVIISSAMQYSNDSDLIHLGSVL